MQSRDACFPLKIVIGKDSKGFLKQEFKSFYNDINLFEDKYGKHNNNNGEMTTSKWSLEICHPADMSALQKLVGWGGAMKQAKYACYCCNVHIDKVHVPNFPPCDFCIANDKNKILPPWGMHRKLMVAIPNRAWFNVRRASLPWEPTNSGHAALPWTIHCR